MTEYYSNDPRVDGVARHGYTILTTYGSRWTTTLQDTARITRFFTVTPGVGFTTTSSSNNRTSSNVTEGGAITPHLAVAWDATHDGRTVVRASFNQYVDSDVGRLAKHTLGGRVSQACSTGTPQTATGQRARRSLVDLCLLWWGASATVGSPCGPSGFDAQGNKCISQLKVPRTWEYTFGAEREVAEGLGAGRRLRVPRLHLPILDQGDQPDLERQAAARIDRNGGYRNGKAQTIIDLETPEEAAPAHTRA